VFWPDSASVHYAKNTLARLEELKIKYVPKEENPSNVPQIRPIKNVWANLKRKVYSSNYRPKDVKGLIATIRKDHEGGTSKDPKGPQTGCNFLLK
jgi:hypothetical protein